MSPDDPRHGTYPGAVNHYQEGEPACGPCKEASAAYKRNRRTRLYLGRTEALMVPSRGTLRRIEALQALGWSVATIGRRAGHSEYWAYVLPRHERVHESTAREVARVYEELSMTLPPETMYTARTRAAARAKGYAPPLAWDDIDNDEAPAPIGNTRTLWKTDDLIAEYEHLLSFGVSEENARRQLKVGKARIEQAYKMRRSAA